jgi:hypothetical protein
VLTPPPPLRASAFVVLSGGAIGAASARQLLRAVAAGRLETRRIFIVDKDARCAASAFVDPLVELAIADWGDWLDGALDDLPEDSQLVPYHWAPHVLVDWLRRQVAKAGGHAARGPVQAPPGLPVDRATRDGDRALSYATWICPPTCIEPRLCPHTRGPKDWSLVPDLSVPAVGVDESVVFPCLHFVYGVGTVPVVGMRAVRDRVLAGLPDRQKRRYLVATSSHCHALAAGLEVGGLPLR